MKSSLDRTVKFLARARPVLMASVTVLVFSLLLIPQKSEAGIYAPNPLRPSYPKRPVRHRLGVPTFGSLAIGDGTATDTIGFTAIISGLLWVPIDGFTATGFTVAMAGSGSKAIGVIKGVPPPNALAHNSESFLSPKFRELLIGVEQLGELLSGNTGYGEAVPYR
jgi:hypothetical protein